LDDESVQRIREHLERIKREHPERASFLERIKPEEYHVDLPDYTGGEVLRDKEVFDWDKVKEIVSDYTYEGQLWKIDRDEGTITIRSGLRHDTEIVEEEAYYYMHRLSSRERVKLKEVLKLPKNARLDKLAERWADAILENWGDYVADTCQEMGKYVDVPAMEGDPDYSPFEVTIDITELISKYDEAEDFYKKLRDSLENAQSRILLAEKVGEACFQKWVWAPDKPNEIYDKYVEILGEFPRIRYWFGSEEPISIQDLRKFTNLPRKKIKRFLEELVEEGWIKKKEITKTISVYWLNTSKIPDFTEKYKD